MQFGPESRFNEIQILTFIDGNVYRTGLADEHQKFDDLGESIKCGVERKFDHLLDGLQPQFDQFARGGPRAEEVHERHFRLLPQRLQEQFRFPYPATTGNHHQPGCGQVAAKLAFFAKNGLLGLATVKFFSGMESPQQSIYVLVKSVL